jgi:hypothetical protein
MEDVSLTPMLDADAFQGSGASWSVGARRGSADSARAEALWSGGGLRVAAVAMMASIRDKDGRWTGSIDRQAPQPLLEAQQSETVMLDLPAVVSASGRCGSRGGEPSSVELSCAVATGSDASSAAAATSAMSPLHTAGGVRQPSPLSRELAETQLTAHGVSAAAGSSPGGPPPPSRDIQLIRRLSARARPHNAGVYEGIWLALGGRRVAVRVTTITAGTREEAAARRSEHIAVLSRLGAQGSHLLPVLAHHTQRVPLQPPVYQLVCLQVCPILPVRVSRPPAPLASVL